MICKKHLLLFLLFILVTNSVKAQKVKGFMGKRFTTELNLGLNYFPATTFHTNAYKKTKKWRTNIHPELTIAFTTGRYTDIGIRLGYDQVKLQLPYKLKFEIDAASVTAELNPSDIIRLDSYFYLLNRKTLGKSIEMQFFVRRYNKKYIAPVGIYQQFSLGYSSVYFSNNTFEGVVNDEVFNSEEYNSFVANAPQANFSIVTDRYHFVTASYFVGNKKTFSNGIYINSGMEFNAVFARSIKKRYDKSDDVNYKNFDAYYFDYMRILSKDLQLSQLFEFKIGVGFIY